MTEIYPKGGQKTSVDMNTNATTTGMDTSTCDQVTFYVNGLTGAHANHIVTLQFSHEDVDGSYQNSTHTKTGQGCVQVTDIKSVAWIRLKVTTVEGGVSTADLCVDPSREKAKRFC